MAVFVLPSIAMASWWNPFSWFHKKIVQPPVVQVSVAVPTNKVNNNEKVKSSTSVDLNLQAKCANQAEKTLTDFTEQMDPYGILRQSKEHPFYQQNHYNQKFNQCFVLVSGAGKIVVLLDAYENKRLLTCTPQSDLIGNSSWLGDLVNGTKYISQESCTNLVNQKMEINL